MTLILIKGGYKKRGPRIIEYRDYVKHEILDFRRNITDTVNKLPQKMNYDNMNIALVEYCSINMLQLKKIRAIDGKL